MLISSTQTQNQTSQIWAQKKSTQPMSIVDKNVENYYVLNLWNKFSAKKSKSRSFLGAIIELSLLKDGAFKDYCSHLL